MIDPQGMGSEELGGPRGHPVGQAVVVLLCGLNLPAHDEEHDEDNGHLLGAAADVGKGAQDVCEELGQRVRLDGAVGIGQRGEVGIVWPNERLDGHALGRTVLAVLQKVEQDDVERAGGGQIARQRQVGDQAGGILGMLAGADVAGAGVVWRGQVGVDGAALAIVEQKVDAQAFVKGHVRVHMGGACLAKVRAGAVARVSAQMAGGRVAGIEPRALGGGGVGHAGRVEAIALGRGGRLEEDMLSVRVRGRVRVRVRVRMR